MLSPHSGLGRTIAIILTVALVIGLIPQNTFAAQPKAGEVAPAAGSLGSSQLETDMPVPDMPAEAAGGPDTADGTDAPDAPDAPVACGVPDAPDIEDGEGQRASGSATQGDGIETGADGNGGAAGTGMPQTPSGGDAAAADDAGTGAAGEEEPAAASLAPDADQLWADASSAAEPAVWPEAAAAQPEGTEAAGVPDAAEEAPIEAAAPTVIGEEESLRGESTKAFRLSDGSMLAATYPQPVHMQDETGAWEAIDATLEPAEASGGEAALRPRRSPTALSLPQGMKAGSALSIGEGRYAISFAPAEGSLADAGRAITAQVTGPGGLESEAILKNAPYMLEASKRGAKGDALKGAASKVKDEAEAAETAASGISALAAALGGADGKAAEGGASAQTADAEAAAPDGPAKPAAMAGTEVEGLSSSVSYPKALKGASLEYTASAGMIKEAIVVDAPLPSYSFEFGFDLGGMVPEARPDGSIGIGYPGEGDAYVLLAPYAYDSLGAACEDVIQVMSKDASGNWVLTVTAPGAWMDDPARVYPTVLDPTVETRTDRAHVSSTFVSSSMPDVNHSAKMETLVGKESSAYGTVRTLVRFDLPALGKGDMVTGATLCMDSYDHSFFSDGTPDMEVVAKRITGDWSNTAVTWDTQPKADATVLDYDYIRKSDKAGQDNWKYFDLDLVPQRRGTRARPPTTASC